MSRKYLWRHEFRGTTKGGRCAVRIVDAFFRYDKVYDLDVTICGQQDTVELEVAMDDAVRVQEF